MVALFHILCVYNCAFLGQQDFNQSRPISHFMLNESRGRGFEVSVLALTQLTKSVSVLVAYKTYFVVNYSFSLYTVATLAQGPSICTMCHTSTSAILLYIVSTRTSYICISAGTCTSWTLGLLRMATHNSCPSTTAGGGVLCASVPPCGYLEQRAPQLSLLHQRLPPTATCPGWSQLEWEAACVGADVSSPATATR